MGELEARYLGQEINRGRVDVFKQKIEEKKVFSLSGDKRNAAAAEVIQDLGITGVTTIEEMLEKTQNGTVNREVAIKNILDLGTAIGECALASGDDNLKQAMLAGSYSTEALLPKPWQGRIDGGLGDVGLAGVVCESLTEKIIDVVKQEKVVSQMETVDFYKNNPEYRGLLIDRINTAIEELGKLINPLKRDETAIISERIKYLLSLKPKKVDTRGVRYDHERREPVGVDGEDGGNGKEKKGGFSYGPEHVDFAKAVIRGVKTDFRRNSPPTWFPELSEKEQEWYELADYLSECSENKTALKDSVKLLEKLWLDDNVRVKMFESQLKQMYERAGCRLAMEKIIQDFCVLGKDDSGLFEFLYLKPQLEKDGKTLKISSKLQDIDTYKNETVMFVCIRKAYPGSSKPDESFASEISRIMALGVSQEVALESWKEQHGYEETQIEVGTAWNFLYNCDFIESADFSRQLAPIDGVKGDAANFVFHPDAKVSGKLKDKKLRVGQDEIKGGPLADWYEYQLANDEYFRAAYEQGLVDHLFPKRLGVGFLDTFKVKTARGEMSMARALLEGKTINFSKMQATKKDIFKNYKDMREGALITFKYLTGQVPLDGKNTQSWAVEINNSLSLLRQQGEMPNGEMLPVLDDPRLYAAIIYSSAGVARGDPSLSLEMSTPDYKENVRQLCMSSFIKSTDERMNVKRMFNKGMSESQKMVFDFIYKGKIRRGLGF